MKYRKTVSAVLAALILLSLLVFPVSAEAPDEDSFIRSLRFYGVEGNESTAFRITENSQNEYVLFLPAGVDAEHVAFSCPLKAGEALELTCGEARQTVTEGQSVDFKALLGDAAAGTLSVSLQDGSGQSLVSVQTALGQSKSVDSVYLLSDDPMNYGRAYVETDKERKVPGSVVMQNAAGAITYSGALEHIKGRGNSTWELPKRPYQIKLSKKADLLNGSSGNAAKKWILLANYADPKLMANPLTLDLGAAMGMDYNMEHKPVDLYYDGEYRGAYLLTEKVEVGKARVNVYDLEDANEKANPGVDLEALPTKEAFTENGACYSYCDGMRSPADYSGGYLIEMDYPARAQAEVCRIKTTHGRYVTVKVPEYASKEEMEYIATMYQSFENAVYHNGVDPDSGKKYSDIVDLESIVQCYLANEITRNYDGFASSAYLYLAQGSDKLEMGPLWDYDLGYREQIPQNPLYTVHGAMINRIYRDRAFREAVTEVYNSRVYPFIRDVLFGEQTGSGRTYAERLEQLDGTRIGDAMMWPEIHKTAWEEDCEALKQYLLKHAEIMKTVYADWADKSDEYHVFADVPEQEWFAKEIWRAEEVGLVHGNTQIEFAPYSTATRAQAVQLLYNMVNPNGITYQQYFTDVKKATWYALAVTWAYENGITIGVGSGQFAPDASIARQDIVVLLYRFYGEPKADPSVLLRFSDREEIAGYAVDAMSWAVENGVMKGVTATRLSPTETANRAQMTALFLRCLETYGTEPIE